MDAQRIADWCEVFPDGQIPIQGPVTHPATLPGILSTRVYLMDLGRVMPAERARLIAFLASRFEILETDVERDLERDGVPILDTDVQVVICQAHAHAMVN
jgi:hypothetical protein